MFQRSIQTEFERLMSQYPIVTIMGPRQAGKTTLARSAYPNRPYYNLENPDTRALIEADPRAFFDSLDLQKGVILDEIQRSPELLSYIQTAVDENRVPGSFILTGSHQLQLTEAISQSLAGRTAILELLPVSMAELNNNDVELSIDEYLFNGFYPAIYQHHLDPKTHARNYLKTYVERDVRQLVNIKDLDRFRGFIRLCAGRISSVINRESLSNDVGVSQGTIRNWMSILSASYLTFQLPPYFENFGKRIIKTPKLYFTDVGIASSLCAFESWQQIQSDRSRGALFENFVILELLKYRFNQGKEANLYFYRDSNQNEVDVIFKTHDKLIPIEIKSASTFTPALLKGIKHFQKLVGERALIAFLVYNGEEQQVNGVNLINAKNLHKMLLKIETL
ncbi:MAG: AAA family ATPase [Legionellaceae bacterium]|nr:AAA family ATPase [Legionellaceae bacterium]